MVVLGGGLFLMSEVPLQVALAQKSMSLKYEPASEPLHISETQS